MPLSKLFKRRARRLNADTARIYDEATVEDAYQQGAVDGIAAFKNYFQDEEGATINELLDDDVLDRFQASALSDVTEDRA